MSESKSEEIISALWLNAGLLSWICGFKAFAIILFIKAFTDTCFSIYEGCKEIIKKKGK